MRSGPAAVRQPRLGLLANHLFLDEPGSHVAGVILMATVAVRSMPMRWRLLQG